VIANDINVSYLCLTSPSMFYTKLSKVCLGLGYGLLFDFTIDIKISPTHKRWTLYINAIVIDYLNDHTAAGGAKADTSSSHQVSNSLLRYSASIL